MARKTAARKQRRSERPVTTKTGAAVTSPSNLSETELDLLSHLQNGYELETDTLGSDVLLRQPKDKEVIRPLSATRNTVKALEERGMVAPAKGDDPLRMVWRLNDGESPKKSPRKTAPESRRTGRRRS
jgi:hypothetical protein